MPLPEPLLLIAPAVAELSVTRIAGTYLDTVPDMTLDPAATEPEYLLEFAGRACYQSFHKPNPDTRRNADYLSHIVESGHLSVLEHAHVSYYVTGVSRSLSLEMARHRHTERSELSQRFVAMDTARIVVPPALRPYPHLVEPLRTQVARTLDLYEALTEDLKDLDLPRKQAREAARALLPNCIETKMVLTFNLRSAREWIGRRIQPDADAEIRELAAAVLSDLLDYAPAVFEDMRHYTEESQ